MSINPPGGDVLFSCTTKRNWNFLRWNVVHHMFKLRDRVCSSNGKESFDRTMVSPFSGRTLFIKRICRSTVITRWTFVLADSEMHAIMIGPSVEITSFVLWVTLDRQRNALLCGVIFLCLGDFLTSFSEQDFLLQMRTKPNKGERERERENKKDKTWLLSSQSLHGKQLWWFVMTKNVGVPHALGKVVHLDFARS